MMGDLLAVEAVESFNALTTPEATREMKPTSNCANQNARKPRAWCRRRGRREERRSWVMQLSSL